MPTTNADQINADILAFLKGEKSASAQRSGCPDFALAVESGQFGHHGQLTASYLESALCLDPSLSLSLRIYDP